MQSAPVRPPGPLPGLRAPSPGLRARSSRRRARSDAPGRGHQLVEQVKLAGVARGGGKPRVVAVAVPRVVC